MLINFLLLFTITNKVILGLILLFGNVKHMSDRILGITVLLPIAVIVNNMLFYNKLYYPFIPFVTQIFAHCIAPFIYMYCLQQLDLKKQIPKNSKYLFLSLLIPAGCWVYFLLFSNEENTRLFMASIVGKERYFLTEILNTAIELQIIGLTVYTYYKIKVFDKQYDRKNSLINIRLSWSKGFLKLIIALSICLMLCDKFFPTSVMEVIILPILSNIFYWYIIVKSFQNSRQYDLLMQVNRFPADRSTAVRKSRIENSSTQIEFIQSYIIENKNYLDKDFALPALAAKLSIPANKLSAVINDQYGMNFSQFINTYRVEEAKIKLTDPACRVLTFEGIAASCGFGSKASFNRSFKEYTGLTPKEYQKIFGVQTEKAIELAS